MIGVNLFVENVQVLEYIFYVFLPVCELGCKNIYGIITNNIIKYN